MTHPWIEDVIEFQKKFGERDTNTLNNTLPQVLSFRRALIEEECNELLDASDLEDIVHELGDHLYVVLGMFVALGVDADEVWRRIHKANMTKFGPGHTFSAAGKVLKSEKHIQPVFKDLVPQEGVNAYLS